MRADELFKVGLKDVKKGPEFKNHVKPNVSTDFKTPHIPKGEIDMKPVNIYSDQNLIPNTTKNGAKLFPWKTVCVIGLGLICLYFILKIPRKKITEEEVNNHHQV